MDMLLLHSSVSTKGIILEEKKKNSFPTHVQWLLPYLPESSTNCVSVTKQLHMLFSPQVLFKIGTFLRWIVDTLCVFL